MSNYHIKHLEEYYKVYRKSVREPENFWEEIAEEHFLWKKKWNSVLQWDFTKPEVKWFDGAKLNITENCIDRHLTTRGNKTAILFEPNNPEEKSEHISYNELHKRVNKFANVLKKKGIQKAIRKGFTTSYKTKITACMKLKSWIESDKMVPLSRNLIREFKTFIAKGKSYEAKSGETDDLVSATLLCIRQIQVISRFDEEFMETLGESLEAGDDFNDPLPVLF